MIMRSNFHKTAFRTVLASALATSALTTAPAMAQQSPEDAEADDQGLDVITVTAQRRDEDIQDVPLSVSILNDDALDVLSSGGADIRSLAGRVPSLNIESSFGRTFPRFYIRGLGNTDFDLNASQPVSLVYDDVVLENPILKGFPVFDMERVEVLRGPQGTLFGRNTPAGIVKFDTVKPGDTGGYARASLGSFGSVNIQGAVGAADDSGFSVRASGSYQRRDNWIDNIDAPGDNNLGGFDDIAARIQLQYESGGFTGRLFGQTRIFDGTAIVFRANALEQGTGDLIGLDGPGSEFRRSETRADGVNFQRLELYNVGGAFEYDFGDVTLYSITSYWNGNLFSRGDVDGGFGNAFAPEQGPGFIPFSAQTQDNVPSLDQFTQELRLASNGGGAFNYQFGVFYFSENLDIETFDFGTPQDVTPAAIALQRQESEAFGIFGSVSYAFDNGLTLQAGARYNDDSRDFVASRPVDVRPGFLGFGGPVAPINENVDANLLTWDLSAVYEVNPDINIFARAARGYRAPSIQGRLAFGRSTSVADSERTMSYEAGIKSTLFGGRARFNLTGYYSNTEDLQLTAVGGGLNFNTLLNAADVESYGFEAEFQARPTDGLDLSVGIGFNENEIQDPQLQTQVCGSPCTVLDPIVAPGIASINGNRLPQSPRWTINWTAGYAVPVGSGEIYAFTDWYYRSEIQFFLYESVEFSDDRLLEGGLRIGYRTDDGKFDIAAFARNITNDTSAVGGIDFNNLTAFVNEPRIFGVEIGTRF
ncbi:MAG: TonB-dependent receptor [Pseudomonadota bacterium]